LLKFVSVYTLDKESKSAINVGTMDYIEVRNGQNTFTAIV